MYFSNQKLRGLNYRGMLIILNKKNGFGRIKLDESVHEHRENPFLFLINFRSALFRWKFYSNFMSRVWSKLRVALRGFESAKKTFS